MKALDSPLAGLAPPWKEDITQTARIYWNARINGSAPLGSPRRSEAAPSGGWRTPAFR
ncbi:MAG: hypothetical protein LBK73_09905 [Treponema sp.]|nr:hypothetical protein [Treponema sp.]